MEAKKVLLRDVQLGAFAAEISCIKSHKPLPRDSPLYRLTPFLASDGFLRVQGRLEEAGELTYGEKHPILVPGRNHLAMLITRYAHEFLKHAGVATMLTYLRNEYWILGGRRVAKEVKRYCVDCEKQDAPAGGEIMPPLPEDRVTPASPFQVMGMDHAGPLYCEDFPEDKFYVLLETCAVTRAVQLELVASMAGVTTCRYFRRLAARRGLARKVYSDNHKGFQKCKELVAQKFGSLAPK